MIVPPGGGRARWGAGGVNCTGAGSACWTGAETAEGGRVGGIGVYEGLRGTVPGTCGWTCAAPAMSGRFECVTLR